MLLYIQLEAVDVALIDGVSTATARFSMFEYANTARQRLNELQVVYIILFRSFRSACTLSLALASPAHMYACMYRSLLVAIA
jgi:hypothetical protein